MDFIEVTISEITVEMYAAAFWVRVSIFDIEAINKPWLLSGQVAATENLITFSLLTAYRYPWQVIGGWVDSYGI